MTIVRRKLREFSHQLGNSRWRPKDQTQHGMVNATRFRFSLLFFLILLAGQFHSAARAQNPPRQFALKAESPKFWRLLDRNAQLVKLAGAFGSLKVPCGMSAGSFTSATRSRTRFSSYFRTAEKKNS